LPYAQDYDYCSTPVYLGKAVPDGWNIGEGVAILQSSKLYDRIMNHRTSIAQVDNLHVNDFLVRILMLDPDWIESAETFLIRKFCPVWNVRVRGFGNKALGIERGKSKISLWDQYHPGRKRIRKHE